MPWSCACLYTFSHKANCSAIDMNTLPCLRHRGEAVFKIGDQVIDIFEPDVKAHRRSAGRPAGGRAHMRAVERDGEALEAAPGGTDAEQSERVDEREYG